MRAKRAKPGVTRIGVLVSSKSSLALASLVQEIFARANAQLGRAAFEVLLVSSRPRTRMQLVGATVAVQPLPSTLDYVLVSPLHGVDAAYEPDARDVQLIRDQHSRGVIAASACLGALTLAAAGVLDDREATTHWNWIAQARKRFPQVRWDAAQMLCDHGDVITAGGYLAAIDLVLSIVSKRAGKDAAHALGQMLLADSVRQKQSVYARKLIDVEVEHPTLSALSDWIARHLHTPLLAEDLAKRSGMSLRSFHRKFFEVYGTTPRKYVQLKRIERAQELLRGTRKSVEQIMTAVGVSDVASFRRVFQRELGYSPAAFRKRLEQRADA